MLVLEYVIDATGHLRITVYQCMLTLRNSEVVTEQ
jgi:hypothetical protein